MTQIKNLLPGVVYPSAESLQRNAERGIETNLTLVKAYREAFSAFAGRTALTGQQKANKKATRRWLFRNR